MAVLWSAWCWAMALTLTLVFGTLAILTAWIPTNGRLYLVWARSWSRVVLFFAGVPVDIEVSEAAMRVPAAIFMANHSSALDILVLFLSIRQNVRFLAKRSLFHIPVLGWSMLVAGFIPVDRRRTDQARDVFEKLEARVKRGLSILVFPEGTRSRDGSLGSFKKSGFLLALKTGLPIVPIGISGAHEILGRSRFRLQRGRVCVRVGDPIPTSGLGVSQREELMANVRAEILRASGRAVPETASRSARANASGLGV